jgi:membrane carboxypeptidase/penicillin-binding protein PbpC
MYQSVEMDTRTGLRADANTPRQFVTERVFLVLPPEAQEWAKANGIQQIPITNNQLPITTLSISAPDPGTVYQISPRIPRENQSVPFRVVSAQALRSVTFYLNNAPLATVTQAPFELWWPLEAGEFKLYAQAVTEEGKTMKSDEVGFSVKP